MRAQHFRFWSAAVLAGIAAPGAAQQASPDDGEIVVTGSRQPGAVAGDIKPEIQLSPADIRSYGVSSVADLLNELAPQTRSDRSSGQPLVLLNGRRISGFNEIRDIPTEAILRVDILPEEVALKYGASADTRVVNIVLRPRFRSKTAELEGGQATDGGAAQANAEAGYLRIQKNGRLNLDARYIHADALTEADRGIVSVQRGSVAPSGIVPDLTGFRTLTRDSDTASLNAVYNHVLPGGLSATINARLQLDATEGENGLGNVLLTVPPGPFGPPAGAPLVLRYATDLGPLLADTKTSQVHAGATLNGDGARWRWSVIGNFDRTDTRSRTATGVDASAFQSAVTGGGDPLAPFAGRVVPRARDTADSLAQGGSIDGLVSGSLVKLPAGTANVAVKLLGSTNSFDATSTRVGNAVATHFNRNIVNGQVNVDLPVTSRKADFGAAIGDLTLNGNFAAQQLSDFGTLTTVGFGFNWVPRPPLTVIVSHTDDHAAPSAQQLQGPVIVSPSVAIFDPATGQTALVNVITGGTTALTRSERQVTKVEVNLKPFAKPDLTLTANYLRTRLTNAIAAFPATSAAIETAFPQRFVRDATGQLVTLDARAVNFAAQASDTLRIGGNLSIPLKSTVANPFAGVRPPGDARPAGAPGGAGGAAGGGDRGGGGRGGGGFGRDGGAGGRIQFAVYDTIFFRNDVLIRPGVPRLDLLNGGALGTNGGQPRHEVEIQAGYSRNGLGARISGNYRSGTSVDASAADPNGGLTFSPLATANLRLFAFPGQIPRLVRDHPWLRGTRIQFSVTNVTDARERVRDATGATPLAYQPGYLDPVGRAFNISFRKLFFTPPVRRAP